MLSVTDLLVILLAHGGVLSVLEMIGLDEFVTHGSKGRAGHCDHFAIGVTIATSYSGFYRAILAVILIARLFGAWLILIVIVRLALEFLLVCRD